MTGLDLTNLLPADGIAAVRSYPRRYRAALAPIADDPEVAALAERVGPEGHSALDYAADTARTLVLLDRALHDVVLSDAPALHPGVRDPAQRVWEGPAMDLAAVLELLDQACAALADRAAHVASQAWYRPATIAGTGEAIEAIDLLREAVQVGADNLRAAQRALAATAD